MAKVKGICISEKKGTKKYQINEGVFIENFGIENDAHGGNWHRQVSLLSYEKIQEFKNKGIDLSFGDFGENLIVDEIDFKTIPVGTYFYCGDVILKMTQIGKECHDRCEIFKRMGDCIMPREGVFAEVIKGGTIKVGDTMTYELPKKDRPFTLAIVTLSDKASRSEREDLSGPLISKIMKEKGYEVIEELILPDEQKSIESSLKRLSDGRQVSLILTTGGTGLSVRDVTPEATLNIKTRNVPGISEAIRAGSMKITKRAMLSRGVSVIRNNTLIINLPGSPKACKESLDMILDELTHGLNILRGTETECSR